MFYHFAEDKDEIKGILNSEGKEIFIQDLKEQNYQLIPQSHLKVQLNPLQINRFHQQWFLNLYNFLISIKYHHKI